MAYLKYYADENRRHKVAESIKLSFTTCAALTAWLCRHFGLEVIPVTLLDKKSKRFSRVKKTKSWYSSGRIQADSSRNGQEIVYHPTMLNPLTVAHEVAHYVHDMDRKKRYTEIRAKWEATKEYTDFAGRLRIRPFPMRKEKWHGPEHRAFVEKGIDALKTLSSLQAYFAETPEGEMARESLKLEHVLTVGVPSTDGKPKNWNYLVAFLNTLERYRVCPKCKETCHVYNFGARVMKRNAEGIPTIIRRQSYCKACR